MEEIRETKISVYINTNKATYKKTFDNPDNAADYFREIYEAITGVEYGSYED